MATKSAAQLFSFLPWTLIISTLVLVALDNSKNARAQSPVSGACSVTFEERVRNNCREGDGPLAPAIFLRQIGWLCAPSAASCNSGFGIPSGSGGADVDAFYSVKYEPTAREVKIDWECPDTDPQREVVVILTIRGHPWRHRTRCAAGTTSFASKEFLGWEQGSVFPTVRLMPRAKCALPVYLVARLIVPAGYFAAPRGKCRNLRYPNACLIVSSVISQRDSWEIEAGPEIQIGTGRIASEQLTISRPERCSFLDLYVDFTERESKINSTIPAPKTTIAELVF